MSRRGGAWSPKRNAFAFKIDYDKAIAQDEEEIAWAERSIERGWYRRSWPFADARLGAYEARELFDLALHCEDVATAAGLTAQDVSDLANTVDRFVVAKHHRPDLSDPQPNPAGHLRGREIAAALEVLSFGGRWLFKSEDDARTALRKARASRARHIRNREAYGRKP